MGGCVMWVRLCGLEPSTRGSVVPLAMFIYVVFGTANDDAKGWVIASFERTVKSILELTTQDRCECLPNQRSCISTPSSTHRWEPAKEEANEKVKKNQRNLKAQWIQTHHSTKARPVLVFHDRNCIPIFRPADEWQEEQSKKCLKFSHNAE